MENIKKSQRSYMSFLTHKLFLLTLIEIMQ